MQRQPAGHGEDAPVSLHVNRQVSGDLPGASGTEPGGERRSQPSDPALQGRDLPSHAHEVSGRKDRTQVCSGANTVVTLTDPGPKRTEPRGTAGELCPPGLRAARTPGPARLTGESLQNEAEGTHRGACWAAEIRFQISQRTQPESPESGSACHGGDSCRHRDRVLPQEPCAHAVAHAVMGCTCVCSLLWA